MTDDLGVARDVMDLLDGRLLEWTSVGPPGGDVLLHHHGTPSGSRPDRSWVRAVTGRGLRLVTPARPGYGFSDRRPGRGIADVAADCAALLDRLEVEQAYVSGVSGGGPHALACGALLGDRVRSVAVIGSVAPYDAPGLDFLAGMAQDNVEEFGASLAGEALLRSLLEPVREELLKGDSEATRAALDGLLPEVDRACLTGEVAEDLALGMADALGRGLDGWIDDDLAFTRPWGFDLEALGGCRVSVWQGQQDLMVPFAHGQWLVAQIPGVHGHLLPDEGHLSIGAGMLDDVLDELLG
ncbi:MAG TPA: alpha/beta hydrolase [Candidatus Limnocylindria bacterium]|nr:alpha/beta hydrolase [Candidatus Limnocylindria bacterium]